MLLEILTRERVLLKEEVNEVIFPGPWGLVGILPGHRKMLSLVSLGVIKFRREGKEEELCYVNGGIAEVQLDRVTILAEDALRCGDIDVERAKRALERAKARIKKATPDIDLERANAALKRALYRLQVAGERITEK